MSKHINKLSKKNLVLLISVVSCVFLYFMLTIISNQVANTQPYNRIVEEWDQTGRSSVIGTYFSDNTCLSLDDIMMLEYDLTSTLRQDSYEATENGRLFVDAYSYKTDVSLWTNRAGNVICTAYAVNADFFKFHNFKLISGSFFSSDDVNHRSIVLDKDAAWKMFGAINVNGMTLEFDGEEYVVAGVVENEEGFMTKQAAANACVAYMPIEVMCEPDEYVINSFEIVFPNPVKKYALNKVSAGMEKLVGDDSNVKIVDCSARYDLISSLMRIRDWTKRGMSFDVVRTPYWENASVGVENVVDLLTLLRFVFIVPAIIIVIVEIIKFHPLHRLKLLGLKVINKIRR